MPRERSTSLRTGFTTGTAAAAAFKAALAYCLDGAVPDAVRIDFLSAGSVEVPVHDFGCMDDGRCFCTVIKDAGDDPDVTHRAEIGARVRLRPDGDRPTLHVTGGEGVGQVTKPGLDVAPGNPAINPGPMQMMNNVLDGCSADSGRSLAVDVEIFVPRGEEMARHTMNARLGILGGISILGTTGIVRPMSHDAYVATIRSGLSVAAACDCRRMVFTTGRRTERFAQTRWPGTPVEAFVQIGDYFRVSMEMAAEHDMSEVILGVMFGKAVKMAQGIPHTHAAKAEVGLNRLADWTAKETGSSDLADRVRACNTAREAFFILADAAPAVISRVGERMVAAGQAFAGQGVAVGGVIFNFDGRPAWQWEKGR